MISSTRSMLARCRTTLIENANPSSRTMAAAASFCGTALMPAIRSARGVVRVLDRDLDVLEPGLAQLLGPVPGEPDAGGDQRRVQTQRARVRSEIFDVRAHERLAARQAELQHAQLAGLGEHPLPVIGRQLPVGANHLERIRAVRAVQRTPMRNLGEQRRRMITRHGPTPSRRAGTDSRSRRP